MTSSESSVTAVVLGILQDGGLPHIGCICARCAAALNDPRRRLYAACLALVDRRTTPSAVWLLDATPDVTWQLAQLAAELGPHPLRPERLRQPDGIFLTHAHMGHIGGLPQFGPEAMAAVDLPVYATPPLLALLQNTTLWRPLLACIQPRPFPPGETLTLAPNLQITAVPVPHRDEWGAGTVAFFVRGPRRSLLYLPDIDAWELWPESRTWMDTADLALVDGSFYSIAELGGRPPVAHPLVPDTLRRFAEIPGQLLLTHLNHTNPLLDEDSLERSQLAAGRARVASPGMRLEL